MVQSFTARMPLLTAASTYDRCKYRPKLVVFYDAVTETGYSLPGFGLCIECWSWVWVPSSSYKSHFVLCYACYLAVSWQFVQNTYFVFYTNVGFLMEMRLYLNQSQLLLFSLMQNLCDICMILFILKLQTHLSYDQLWCDLLLLLIHGVNGKPFINSLSRLLYSQWIQRIMTKK